MDAAQAPRPGDAGSPSGPAGARPGGGDPPPDPGDAEWRRLTEDAERAHNWKRWGPYLAERQWGTVREDYSENGTCWEYLPHDHARSRAYRWGEDGLLGACDREGRLCFALALWNGRDPILKERLFGLTGDEGNHGEDVKECYFYLDSSPTHSYFAGLYKYPQAEFPYRRLVEESARRDRSAPEYELADTGVFDESRYWDVRAEYAKASPDDLLIRITVANRGPEAARLHLLPTLWFRNTWAWGREGEGYWPRPRLATGGAGEVTAEHADLGRMVLAAAPGPDGAPPARLFTGNETDAARLFGTANPTPYVKDAFHRRVVEGREDAVNPAGEGTKAALWYVLEVPAGGETIVRLRLSAADQATAEPFGSGFERTFAARIAETDAFYQALLPAGLGAEERRIARQAYAGLLWSKQFYHLIVKDWLEGDPAQPPAPAARRAGRDADWSHLYARDLFSMPDKWEYPWFASWDLAFHAVALARLDPEHVKKQLLLLLREWYMHPNGQIPAYEFAFGDVNPPVHAWACWRVYKMSAPRGRRDRLFLERAFHKLLLNFTWWVNRKDVEGRHLFAGGFLGLDNIGVFDRSKPLPTGGFLEQADGTAWMAFFCGTLLSMALELAGEDPAYEDIASKFLEHFVAIADATNARADSGLWDEADGFYYDELHADGRIVPLKVRSMVGLVPLLAVENLEEDVISRLPGFRRRLEWFVAHRGDLARHVVCGQLQEAGACRDGGRHRMIAIAPRERLERVLAVMLDEAEFLSPFGLRSLSRIHQEHPYVFQVGSAEYRVAYAPGESDSGLFGGNSNWRGPVWFPLNMLLIEALERYHHFYGDGLTAECPTGSGRRLTLDQVAAELRGRLARLFLPDAAGRRPLHGDDRRFASDPAWRDLLLYHEYFHADSGRGLGASHQTGWTALIARCLEDLGRKGPAPPAGD